MFDIKTAEVEIEGKLIKIETGRMARQASGAVLVTCGETVVLATVVGAKKAKDGIDFFPLTVDFIEKLYASGKIPGGFIKREAKPSMNATLTSRLIDRPLRPLFPAGFKNEVQIALTVLSYDGENTPDVLGMLGASAALTISDIPFMGPAAGVVVGYIDGKYVLNPTPEQLEITEIDLKVAGSKDAITMVEAGAREVSEELMLGAIMFGHDNIKKLCAMQEEFQKSAGKPKMEFVAPTVPQEIVDFIEVNGNEKLKAACLSTGKLAREEKVEELGVELEEKFAEKFENKEIPEDVLKQFRNYYHDMMQKFVRDAILYNSHRVDGRKLDEIRPITMEIDTIPTPHGSALFTRGETQALVITTLGTKEDEQIIDGLDEEERSQFYLHYNFPPFSVGEIGRMGAPGRRELGHGALAERAISYVLPDHGKFPYTIRIVSEILESNGSSSMASVCGGSLSLMDAGVPIKSHVAGIAMGLIKEGDDFTILTDIMGLEDHLGDMDFKVAGTRKGITALQMDIKITGINEEIMRKSLAQALEGRMYLLGRMEQIIDVPRAELASNAPRLTVLNVPTDKIAELIGPGGKNIKGIVEKTGAKIDIQDDGTVMVFAENAEKMAEAVKLVTGFTKKIEAGEIYLGKVKKIAKFGAFMEILPGKEALLHVSEISHERVKEVEDVLKLGDEMMVKVLEVDAQGKVSISRKALLDKATGNEIQ